MHRKLWIHVLGCCAVLVLVAPARAQGQVLLHTYSPCAYNDAIGYLLDGTSPLFPNIGDPVIDPAPQPDLTPAAAVLGNWLASSPQLDPPWQIGVVPTSSWLGATEVARVYSLTTPALDRLTIQVGVDNGAFVYWDGVYLGGHLRPGFATLGELTFVLASVPAGRHHLQILCEDHGGSTGFSMLVTGELTASASSFGAGCPGSAGVPTLAALGRPLLGQQFPIQTTNCPAGATFLLQLVGFSNSSWNGSQLPLALDPYGLAGCMGLVSADAVLVASASGGSGNFQLAIPSAAFALGGRIYFQSLVPDSGVNPAGLTTSQGLAVVAGTL